MIAGRFGLVDAPSVRPIQVNATAPVILKRRADFLRVAKGLRRNYENFTLQAAKPALDCPRVGLTITKAVGGATERNRIRRRLKAALRTMGGALPPADFVILARRGLLHQDFIVLKQSVTDAMHQAAKRLETQKKESRTQNADGQKP